jgi:hypothetical protein
VELDGAELILFFTFSAYLLTTASLQLLFGKFYTFFNVKDETSQLEQADGDKVCPFDIEEGVKLSEK